MARCIHFRVYPILGAVILDKLSIVMKATYVRVLTFEQNISRQLAGKEGEVY